MLARRLNTIAPRQKILQTIIAFDEAKDALVLRNAAAKVGTRSLTFKVGRKSITTGQVRKALADGKRVSATVVVFKKVGGSKIGGAAPVIAKVRVKGTPIGAIEDQLAFATFANAWVFGSQRPKSA